MSIHYTITDWQDIQKKYQDNFRNFFYSDDPEEKAKGLEEENRLQQISLRIKRYLRRYAKRYQDKILFDESNDMSSLQIDYKYKE